MMKAINLSHNCVSGRRALALALGLVLAATTLPLRPTAAQAQPAAHRLSDEQRIAHVLNRLGFGARPGDVARVQQLGLERYLDQQLHPEQLADAALEARLRALPTLSLPTYELLAKYPQPGQLLRQLQRQGQLPADLQALVAQGRPGGAGNPPGRPNAAAPAQADAMTGDMMPNDAGAARPGDNNAAAAPTADRAEYRAAIRQYMQEHGLQPPQRITAELQAARILRAVYSERQLQEVLVDFWTNHFNVFAGKGADRWLLTAYDRDTIRPHALGKFKDLLVATAQSPAMLFYLDNFQSVSPNAPRGGQRAARPNFMPNNPRAQQRRNRQPGGLFAGPAGAQMQLLPTQQTPARPQPTAQRPRRGINENYARELMELHTLGVDGGYTQQDVQEVARCFTGWTILDPRGRGGRAGLVDETRAGSFYFNPRLHDDGAKVVLGHKIPAGGGVNDGLLVLDILAHQPATARFIATKLARKFVVDNPTPELVNRIAAAFTRSDGDIRATLQALIAAPEFNAPETYRAKIKTPFELAVSAVRALGGETNGGPAFHQWLARMGEPLYQYQPPTGYPDTAEHWVNTGALLERINFALALVANRIPGTRVDLTRFAGRAGDSNSQSAQAQLLEQLATLILQDDLSAQTKASLLKKLNEPVPDPAAATGPATTATAMNAPANATTAMNAPAAAGDDDAATPRPRRMARHGLAADGPGAPAHYTAVARIAALVLGSPEFQRQ